MFKFRRSRKKYYDYGSFYSRKPKRYPKISLWWLIISIPLLIILLELLANVFLALTGKGTDAEGRSPLVSAYRLQFLTENEKPIAGLASQGSLAVKRSTATAYQLVGQQKNQFWQINEQGFRDSEPLPLAKPKKEVRIFLLGGSTAFGQGAQNNQQTIAHQLETLLQQRVAQQQKSPAQYRPDVFPFFKPSRQKLMQLPPKIRPGKYRTISAAVPGYASGNELAQLVFQVLPYQPDLVIVLDGYGDLMLPSRESQADIPKVDEFLQNATKHFQTYWSQASSQWLKNTAIARTFTTFSFSSQPNIAEQSLSLNLDRKSLSHFLPKDEAEVKRRVARYQNNHAQIIRLCANAGIPVVVAIQPEITGIAPDKLSLEEKAIREQLGKDYIERFPKAYSQFVQANQQLAKQFPKNVKVVNLYNLGSPLSKTTFSDAIHLTEKANTAIAQKLYQSLTSWEKIQIIPQNFYLKE